MFSLGPSKLHSWSCLPQLSSLWTWYYVLFPEAYLRSSGSDSFLSSGSKTEVGIKEPLQRFWPKQRNPLNIALPSEPAQHLEGGGCGPACTRSRNSETGLWLEAAGSNPKDPPLLSCQMSLLSPPRGLVSVLAALIPPPSGPLPGPLGMAERNWEVG